MKRTAISALALLLIVQAGCGYIQKPGWDKPWGKGAVIPAVVCCAIGAGIGIAIQNERPGTSEVRFTGEDGQTRIIRSEDDKELWKGAVVGCPIGAAVCAVAGHVLFDKPLVTPRPTPPPTPTPTPEPTPPPVRRRIVLRGVNFDFDQDAIRPDAAPVLDEAAAILRDNPDIKIVVEGHTDALGDEQYNLDLSIRRAEAVYRYLVNKGVDPERMVIEGYGESRPVADNETEAGRAQNRRVELRVLP